MCTYLFHNEGSSSCKSIFISSNTFWDFSSSSSAYSTQEEEYETKKQQEDSVPYVKGLFPSRTVMVYC